MRDLQIDLVQRVWWQLFLVVFICKRAFTLLEEQKFMSFLMNNLFPEEMGLGFIHIWEVGLEALEKK